MPKTFRVKASPDEIADRAGNVDLTQGMLRELDARAARLKISRQAVIKTLLDRALRQERLTADQSFAEAKPETDNAETGSNVHRLLLTAIDQKRLIRLQYRNEERVFEPHDYGIHHGTAKLLAGGTTTLRESITSGTNCSSR